jgi:hypothetical protein
VDWEMLREELLRILNQVPAFRQAIEALLIDQQVIRQW